MQDFESSSGRPARRILGVSEVTRAIRDLLESSFPRIFVRGEISNLSRPQSGHLYFSLIDDAEPGRGSRYSSAQLSCVIWRSTASRLRRRLENGLKVVLGGRIGVYEPRGTYQLIGDTVELAGFGELQRLYEELKERLRREGLFSPDRKRPVPFLPGRIGLITSPGGAAIQDVLRVLYRRLPRAWVRIVPVRVQGEGAVEDVSRALRIFNAEGGQVDVIVIARGGGSLEDLWPFNDEGLARAVVASSVPVVSAVGHEVDFSITDFVADLRAQTPTQAAELISPDVADLEERLAGLRRRLALGIRGIRARKERDLLRILKCRHFRRPQVLVEELFERVDDVGRGLENQLYNLRSRWEDALTATAGRLEALNPLKVLSRGYSLTTDEEHRVVMDASRLRVGQILDVVFSRGRARAEVLECDVSGRTALRNRSGQDPEGRESLSEKEGSP
jgi:exodeoxyribonuclease VII large subunit